MSEIFLSYSRFDVEFVRSLGSGLEQGGYSVFYDKELVGGQRWWDALLDHIEGCTVFVPVLTENYTDSEPCRREAGYAAALNKIVLPVAHGGGVSAGVLIPAIAEAQWVEFGPDAPSSIWTLVKALNRLPDPRPLPDTSPMRPAVPISYLVQLQEAVDSTEDLPRLQQLDILDQLIAKTRGADRADMERLMRRLRNRPEVVLSVAERIDEFFRYGDAGASGDRAAPPPPARATPHAEPSAPRPRIEEPATEAVAPTTTRSTEPTAADEPGDAREYGIRGDERVNAGDLDGAIADFTEAIRLAPELAVAYSSRGYALGVKGDVNGAIADYTEAIRLDPDLAFAYKARGDARNRKHDMDGAIADYTEAIRLDPDDAVAYNNRGTAREKKGDIEGAIADYAGAIRVNPRDAVFARNLGRIRSRQKHWWK